MSTSKYSLYPSHSVQNLAENWDTIIWDECALYASPAPDKVIPSAVVAAIPDESPGPEELADFALLKDQISQLLATIPAHERKVLELRYGLNNVEACTLEEAGAALGVTRERIRQIEQRAIRRLRHPARSRKLRDFIGCEWFPGHHLSQSDNGRQEKTASQSKEKRAVRPTVQTQPVAAPMPTRPASFLVDRWYLDFGERALEVFEAYSAEIQRAILSVRPYVLNRHGPISFENFLALPVSEMWIMLGHIPAAVEAIKTVARQD